MIRNFKKIDTRFRLPVKIFLSTVGFYAIAQTAHCKRICRFSHISAFILRYIPGFVKCFVDNIAQTLVDFLNSPGITIPVLHPLKIADCHATRICQDIGHYENFLFLDHVIDVPENRPIRNFYDMSGFDAVDIIVMNDTVQGGRDEDINIEFQYLLIGYRFVFNQFAD